ncbi:MAG: DEAD/DEAH box helicase [Clostridia bacterium]|nr:DEAD/DEAH box helicase [Clostridia bacterium]
MKTFNELNISPKILQILEQRGFVKPTEIQEKAIPLLMQNQSLIGLSQTGTGKTLAFLIPLLEKIVDDVDFVQAIILCPTRELCLQTGKEAKMLAKNIKHIKVTELYGGTDMSRQIYALKRRANIIVGTPGRVLDHIKRHTLKLGGVSTVVLDEADEMLNMGFRADIEAILNKTPFDRQTVMFSATMNNEIMALTKNYMTNPVQVKVGQANTTLGNIKQTYFLVPKDKKKKALHSLLNEIERGKTLIFCNTKAMVSGVQSYLEKMGYPVAVLHGDMPQRQRTQVMRAYKEDETDILITTDVSARGIDVSNIRYVINYDLPQNMEYYIHRIGRTGRAGKEGCAYTILNSEDQAQKLKEIGKKTQSTITYARLNLEAIKEIKPTEPKKVKYKKLNTKKRESRNPRQKSDSIIRTKSGAKLGARTRTLRNVHKSKISGNKKSNKK